MELRLKMVDHSRFKESVSEPNENIQTMARNKHRGSCDGYAHPKVNNRLTLFF